MDLVQDLAKQILEGRIPEWSEIRMYLEENELIPDKFVPDSTEWEDLISAVQTTLRTAVIPAVTHYPPTGELK